MTLSDLPWLLGLFALYYVAYMALRTRRDRPSAQRRGRRETETDE